MELTRYEPTPSFLLLVTQSVSDAHYIVRWLNHLPPKWDLNFAILSQRNPIDVSLVKDKWFE